jgi:hypothetical protein
MTTPANTDASANAEVQFLKFQATAVSKSLDRAKAQASKAKGNDRDRLNAQIKNIEAHLGKLNDTINKIYVKTGQYDKLLTGANRDAFLAVQSLFGSYDLGSLSGKIYEYVKNGYSADTISILLQDTTEYKTRFAGNEARKKAGLPVLSPAEYLSTEASYKQIMSSAGLPSGFYDQPSDFSDWIGKDVSPTEIQSRVDLATQATVLANPTYKQALNAMGIQDDQLTAYFLDQSKALPYLQKAAATAQIGAEALSQGLTFDQTYSADLATLGISRDEAKAGYSNIAGERVPLQSLAGIYGDTWTQREAEQAVFESNASEINKRKGLISKEVGQFSGTTGGARSGLAGVGGAR